MTLFMTALIAAVVALAAIPAHALVYTFTGENGLSGTLTFDETVPIAVTKFPFGSEGIHTSPLNHISGQFGAYEFEGSATLAILDVMVDGFALTDLWVARADITSPAINGLSLDKLNLLIFRHPAITTAISFEPPTTNFQSDFQYVFEVSDQSFIVAPLTSLVFVREPSSLVLTAVGMAAVLKLVMRRERAA